MRCFEANSGQYVQQTPIYRINTSSVKLEKNNFFLEENNNLRKKINELKNDKNALEIRLNNLENFMIADKTKGPEFHGEGGRIRHDYEVLKYKYAETKKRLLEYEKGDKRDMYNKNQGIKDYIKMMRQLENENDRLKRMLKDTDIAPKMLQRKGDEIMILQENRKLKDENKLLKEEARANGNLIQRLKRSKPGGNQVDLVAMENLKQANQRLLQQVMRLQEAFDSSLNRTNLNNGASRMDETGRKFEEVEPVMIKSEWERV